MDYFQFLFLIIKFKTEKIAFFQSYTKDPLLSWNQNLFLGT